MGAVGLLLLPRGCLLEVAATIAVLQARTDERTQNPQASKGRFFLFPLASCTDNRAGGIGKSPPPAHGSTSVNLRNTLGNIVRISREKNVEHYTTTFRRTRAILPICSSLIETVIFVRGD
jgi:hypothetical protein